MTLDPTIGLFTLLGFITAIFVVWILSVYPQILSSSLEEFKKPTVLECFLCSVCIIILFIVVGSDEISWGQKETLVVFYLILIISSWTDIRENIIPNRLLLAGSICWIFLTIYSEIQFTEAVKAGGILAAVFFVCSYLWNRVTGVNAVGMGDIKLLFLTGLFTGWEGVWLVYISICIGALVVLPSMLFQKFRRNSHMPFAPFLLLGCITGSFYLKWEEVWRWLNAF